ncbi:hypothetical protein PSECIP111854_00914 [Pseudoalteromonas sp. CIP111854]|uniref:Uncharacterized protein n=1 Tax=Pseudoalteromonas holothuriae TaxID=2963714 RepID=A0A9W4VNM3_9GAMM|nr:hypothetical protein [Pseudoalteromonas sp. CIP111854]CAH9052170.1 hypothetical protein PSECIP111854_00914 [Pseudoalteromonas sp. CIP111854]
MELDAKITAALIGIFGLLLASVLSAAGYFYRSVLDSKRSARVVLYMLFEIRYVVKQELSCPITEADESFDRFHKHMQPFKIDEEIRLIEPLMKSKLESANTGIKKASVDGVLERMIEPYEESLKELAQKSPVLAFKLKGIQKHLASAQTRIDLIKNLPEFHKELLDGFPGKLTGPLPERISNLINKAASDSTLEIKQNIMEEIEQNIMLVAKHCSIIDKHRSKKLLSIKEEDLNLEYYQNVDEYFNEFTSELMAIAKEELDAIDRKAPVS